MPTRQSALRRHSDGATAAFLRTWILQKRPNLLVTLMGCSESPHPTRAPTAAEWDELQEQVSQWTWRMANHAIGRARERIGPPRWFPFMAFPEDRNSLGEQVSPHYHILLRLNEAQVNKFESFGALEWSRVLNVPVLPGDLYDIRHIECSDEAIAKVAAYCTNRQLRNGRWIALSIRP